MNNIVESYLMFKANNVCKYIDILAQDMRVLSKIPKQLNKLIYKYYDLFVLSNKDIDYELLKKKTGLDESNDRLVLFYLLIEFDIASRTEFREEKLYELYNFIVNSIIIFVDLEREKLLSKDSTYDVLIQKVLKRYLEYIDDDYICLLDKVHVLISKEYIRILKKEVNFRENYNSDVYSVYFSKIKKSDNFYLGKFRYKNDKLNDESKRDVELIDAEFLLELGFINIEMTSMKILDDLLLSNDRRIFVRICDDVVLKKSNLISFMNLVKLRFLRERMIFLVNTGLLEKNEEKVNYLVQNGFNVSYFKNSELTSYDIYKNGGYFFVDGEEDIKACLKFSKENNLTVVVSKGNKKKIEKLNNVMYVL